MIYDSFFLKSRNSLRKNENNKIVHKDVMVFSVHILILKRQILHKHKYHLPVLKHIERFLF